MIRLNEITPVSETVLIALISALFIKEINRAILTYK